MTPHETAAAEADARIVDGYHVLLSENLRLAHMAMMEYANAHNDDFWPKARDVIPLRTVLWREADGPRGPCRPAALPDRAAHCLGRCGAGAGPRAACPGWETFARDALVSFGIFCAAADTLAREAATVH